MTPKHTQDGSVFLKHCLPLGTDRIVKLVLPVDLSAREALHIQQFIDALVMPKQSKKSVEADWPFVDDDEEEADLLLTETDLEPPSLASESSGSVDGTLFTKPE